MGRTYCDREMITHNDYVCSSPANTDRKVQVRHDMASNDCNCLDDLVVYSFVHAIWLMNGIHF